MINQGTPNFQSSTNFLIEPKTIIKNFKTEKNEEILISEVTISKTIENILNKIIASKHNPSSRLRGKIVEKYNGKYIELDDENQISDLAVDVIDSEGMEYPISVILKAYYYLGISNEKIYYLEIIAII